MIYGIAKIVANVIKSNNKIFLSNNVIICVNNILKFIISKIKNLDEERIMPIFNFPQKIDPNLFHLLFHKMISLHKKKSIVCTFFELVARMRRFVSLISCWTS